MRLQLRSETPDLSEESDYAFDNRQSMPHLDCGRRDQLTLFVQKRQRVMVTAEVSQNPLLQS